MCGIFAFCGQDPDAKLLQAAGYLAGTRGPHAHGFAVPGDPWEVFKGAGSLGQRSALRAISALGCEHGLIIGHSRLATRDNYTDPESNQPLVCGRTLVAHNGVVHDYDMLVYTHGLPVATGCDSEVIGWLVERHCEEGQSLAEALESTMSEVFPRSPWAVVVARDGEVAAQRERHPLYACHHSEGDYLCSRELPGSEPVAEGRAFVLPAPSLVS